MAPPSCTFTALVWEYDGPAAWFFVSLPEDCADRVAEAADTGRPGFGSVRVEVAIGSSRWRTSVFPDSKRGTYVLPVKKAVRKAEGLGDGSAVAVALTVLDAER